MFRNYEMSSCKKYPAPYETYYFNYFIARHICSYHAINDLLY